MRLTFERGGGGGAGEAPVAGIVVVVVALPWGSLDGDAPRWLLFAGAAAAFRVSPESRNTAVVLVCCSAFTSCQTGYLSQRQLAPKPAASVFRERYRSGIGRKASRVSPGWPL